MLHGRVGGRDSALRHQADDRDVLASSGQLILQRLGEQVADLSLTGGAAKVERLGRNLVCSALGAKQRCAHLRSVAMGDDEMEAVVDESNNRCRCPTSIGELLGSGAFLPGADQGVATYGDEHGLQGSSQLSVLSTRYSVPSTQFFVPPRAFQTAKSAKASVLSRRVILCASGASRYSMSSSKIAFCACKRFSACW